LSQALSKRQYGFGDKREEDQTDLSRVKQEMAEMQPDFNMRDN
jgi:hypothetical protein